MLSGWSGLVLRGGGEFGVEDWRRRGEGGAGIEDWDCGEFMARQDLLEGSFGILFILYAGLKY